MSCVLTEENKKQQMWVAAWLTTALTYDKQQQSTYQQVSLASITVQQQLNEQLTYTTSVLNYVQVKKTSNQQVPFSLAKVYIKKRFGNCSTVIKWQQELSKPRLATPLHAYI